MKKITLIPNDYKDPGYAVTRKVIERLAVADVQLFLSESIKPSLGDITGVSYLPYGKLFDSDMILTLGGDGTILQIASDAAENGVPILGLNLGRVGFLAEVDWKKFELLPALLEGKHGISERMRLDLLINGKLCGTALNDICITADHPVKLVDFDLAVDKRKLSHYRADGLIIATPTGSTAYTLSAGGPVIDPRIDCICITPICSIARSHNCPIVFSGDSEIEITGIRERGKGAAVTVDGMIFDNISPEDKITIRKSMKYLKLIRLENQEFYDILFMKSTEETI